MALCMTCGVVFEPRPRAEPYAKTAAGVELWQCPPCDTAGIRRTVPGGRSLQYATSTTTACVKRTPIPDELMLVGVDLASPPPKTRFDLLAEGGLDVGDDE